MPAALVLFDAYGTIFDVHSAIGRVGASLGAEAAAISALWRQKQLEYTWVRSLADRYRDFEALTAEALDFALAAHGLPGHPVRGALLEAYRTLDAYPDVAPALAEIRADGARRRLAIFTNGTPGMIGAAVAASGLQRHFDALVSVDPVRRFKTAPEVYAHAAQAAAAPGAPVPPPRNVVLISSNRWDVAGARACGMQAIWCNRSGQPDEYADLAPAAIVPDLSGLSGAIRALT